MRVKLTDRFLQSPRDPQTGKLIAPAEGKRVRIWDAHTNGLGLRITSTGAKSFFVVRRLKGEKNGQPITVVLGSYPDMSLAAARERADEVLGHLKKGEDPREVEAAKRKAREDAKRAKEARKINAFSNVAEIFIKRYLASKRTAVPIAQLVRKKFVGRWNDTPISDIGRGDIIKMVEEIAEDSPSAASQALIYCRLLFDWAIERGTYGITLSPCASIKASRLIPDTPGRRDRVLDDREIRLIWEAAWPQHASDEDVFPVGQFLCLLLILGCRRGELSGMTWDEIDLSKATWRLEGRRTKNGDPRLIPLPAMAVEILAAMPRFTGPHVFSSSYGRAAISSFTQIKDKVDRRVAKLNGGRPLADWRLHDLRRSMRTNLSALAILPVVAELMIGHRQRGIAAVYDLHAYEAEQRVGFEAWCARLSSIVDPPENTTNVVQMATVRA
jgi:integrase